MKAIVVVSVILVAAVGVGVALAAESAAKAKGPVRHIVLFKFKDAATPGQIKKVEEGFVALPSKIPGIKEFEWGTNISAENKSEGYTHCFVLTFADEVGRDAYLPHPAHKEFAQSLGPVLDKVLVLDYIVKK